MGIVLHMSSFLPGTYHYWNIMCHFFFLLSSNPLQQNLQMTVKWYSESVWKKFVKHYLLVIKKNLFEIYHVLCLTIPYEVFKFKCVPIEANSPMTWNFLHVQYHQVRFSFKKSWRICICSTECVSNVPPQPCTKVQALTELILRWVSHYDSEHFI